MIIRICLYMIIEFEPIQQIFIETTSLFVLYCIKRKIQSHINNNIYILRTYSSNIGHLASAIKIYIIGPVLLYLKLFILQDQTLFRFY